MEDEIKDLREKLTKGLQEKGWDSITYNVKPLVISGRIDILAQSSGFRKKKLMLVIAENEFDANIASLLLQGIQEKTMKILFLQAGNPKNVKGNKSIIVLTDEKKLPNP